MNGLDAYLRKPQRVSKTGVLLLPTVAGVNALIQDAAARLAEEGFIALAWEPYSGKPRPKDLPESLAMSQQLFDEPVLAEQSNLLTYMIEELGVSSIGIVGWCLGGRYALLLPAQDHRVGASVAYHPSIHDHPLPHQELDPAGLAGNIRCPLQVIYPGADSITSRATFDRLAEALLRMPASVDLQVYPGADHGFSAPHAQGKAANAHATKLAWPATVAFLRAALSE